MSDGHLSGVIDFGDLTKRGSSDGLRCPLDAAALDAMEVRGMGG